MAPPPQRIIEDEEEFLNDVAAFHEKRGYVTSEEFLSPSFTILTFIGPILTAMERSAAVQYLFTNCTSWSLLEAATMHCQQSACTGEPWLESSGLARIMKAA